MSPEVAAFLAKGGRIRRFQMGESANPSAIIEWMQQNGATVRYIGRGKCKLNRTLVDLAGLIDAANQMRVRKGLEPYSLAKSKTLRHFFFPNHRINSTKDWAA